VVYWSALYSVMELMRLPRSSNRIAMSISRSFPSSNTARKDDSVDALEHARDSAVPRDSVDNVVADDFSECGQVAHDRCRGDDDLPGLEGCVSGSYGRTNGNTGNAAEGPSQPDFAPSLNRRDDHYVDDADSAD